MKRFFISLKNALRGILYVFVSQKNFKIHTVFAIAAVILAAILKFTYMEWAVLVLIIGVVMSCEALNTAIERTVDLVSPDYDERAKQAKDSAAAAVLIAAVSSVIIGILLFVIKIINFIKGNLLQ